MTCTLSPNQLNMQPIQNLMHTTDTTMHSRREESGILKCPRDLHCSAARPSLTFSKHVLKVLALPFITIADR